MATFAQKNEVTKESTWEVLGKSDTNIGKIEYHCGFNFVFYPNSLSNRTGISLETLEEIVDFIKEKNSELKS